jgi:hypothetical protein
MSGIPPADTSLGDVLPVGGFPPAVAPGPSADVGNPANLHVIAPYFNFYQRANVRRNYQRYAAHIEELGATLHRVELVLGALAFEVTEGNNPLHTQLRTMSEFFQKENLINIGKANAVRHFPNLQYLAWPDADVTFLNPDIVRDTMIQLNRHPVVQMWAFASPLDPDNNPLEYDTEERSTVGKSFGYCYVHGMPMTQVTQRWGWEWHTGYAWAMRRSVWDAIGGLYEHAIIGSADNHMAWAFAGKSGWGLDPKSPHDYQEDCRAWCDKVIPIVGRDVGYVDGMLLHHWHGRRSDRRYVERNDVVVKNGYDPSLDLYKDAHGLLHLTNRKPGLLFDIRAYMRSRNDDANTVR